MFKLIWNNEVIDEFDTEYEAVNMAKEYAAAFKGYVEVVKGN